VAGQRAGLCFHVARGRLCREKSVPTEVSIIHLPAGIDHPYEPYFEERRPRDPSAGDMVALGFLTRPGNTAESVRVDWTRNGKPQAPIFARAIQRNAAEDRWLVEIGVVEAGDDVEYRITARTEGGRPQDATPPFRFKTREWASAADWHVSTTPDGRQALVSMRSTDQPGITLAVSSNLESNVVRVELVAPLEMTPNSAKSIERVQIGDNGASLNIIRDGQPPLPFTVRWQIEGDAIVALELTAPLAPIESLCGFGERFDALDQHGRAPDVAVYEQYKNQGSRTYLPIPFFLSSNGYGLLIEGATTVNYDLGRTAPDRWRVAFETPASIPTAIDWFLGPPAEIVRSFTAIVGRPEPLPLWAYGVWMSSNEWNTQARVEQEVEKTQLHEIPATVVVLEAWSDEATFYIWNGATSAPSPGDAAPSASDFTYPPDGPWPDPKAMIDNLHRDGLRTVLWQIPALKDTLESHPQHDQDVENALANGFVIEDDDGSPYRNPFYWFNNAHIPDFSNPAAAEWWLNKRRYLLDEMGVDGFKTDGGEHLSGRGLRAASGMRGGELVNAFPDLYAGAYHRFVKERRGRDALTFSRAGHTRAGLFPAHWAGDENSTWEAFRRSIVAGLTAGLSGVTFWGWDIAGFSDALPTVELYLRATAMATFCPIMQYHSEWNPPGMPSRDRTPWNIADKSGDPRAISLFRHFANLRMNLLPYITREAQAAVTDGTPLMRALLLDFPDDPKTWTIQDQYLFGRDLLVAPFVVEGSDTRTVYLPQGEWFDFWTGDARHGPIAFDVTMDLDRIPIYVRGGASIPLRLGADRQLFEPTGNGTSLTNGLVIVIAGPMADEVRWLDEQQRLSSANIKREQSGQFTADGHPVTLAALGSLGFHPA